MNVYVKIGVYLGVYFLLIVGFFFSNWKTIQKKKQEKSQAPWPLLHGIFLFSSILAPLFFKGPWKWLALLSLVIVIAVYRDREKPNNNPL